MGPEHIGPLLLLSYNAPATGRCVCEDAWLVPGCFGRPTTSFLWRVGFAQKKEAALAALPLAVAPGEDFSYVEGKTCAPSTIMSR